MTKAATREVKKKAGDGIRWRLWFGIATVCVLCVSTAMAARRVAQFVGSDPQFVLSHENRQALTFEGLVYTARPKVQRVFAADFERSIFTVSLAERRRRLLAIDWVEDASVSRVWPDRLVVRIRERRPVAFVNFRSGVMLIDRHGVLLEPPVHVRFAFPVISGISEDQAEAQRAARVRPMLRLLEELGDRAKDASEINVADVESLRLIAQVGGQAVELNIGDVNFGRRYRNFLSHYPEIHRRSPEVRVFDLRLDDRILAKE
jgi:cell division protein FtsQ